jgi:hypothetical protein
MPIALLWDAIADHFFAPASMSRIVAISAAELQVEGWLKGELIWHSTITILKLAKSGRLPAFRIGSCVTFCPKAVASWLRRR